MRSPMQDLGAGPNARPRREAPLSSDFMTSSCSVNRVTIADVKYQHENWARLQTFDNRGNSLVLMRTFFINNEICMAFLQNSQAQFSRCIWQIWAIYTKTMTRGPRGAGPMELHRLHRFKAGPAVQLFLLISNFSYIEIKTGVSQERFNQLRSVVTS